MPIFYFLFQNKSVIQVEGTMVIARAEGNVVLTYDPSTNALNCKIEKNLQPSVDNVFINGKKLTDETVLLKVGDVLLVGKDEYQLFESYEEAESMAIKPNRRRYKRPKTAYALSNLVNFYCAPPWALVTYFILFSFLLSRYFPRFYVEAPKHLTFLSEYYNQRILGNFLMGFIAWWLLCLLHSFLMYVYFNRNAGRKTVLAIVFIPVTAYFTYAHTSSLSSVKNYLVTRERIWKERSSLPDKSVNRIKMLVDDKNEIFLSHENLKKLFSEPELKVLSSDVAESVKKVDSEIKGHLDSIKL